MMLREDAPKKITVKNISEEILSEIERLRFEIKRKKVLRLESLKASSLN